MAVIHNKLDEHRTRVSSGRFSFSKTANAQNLDRLQSRVKVLLAEPTAAGTEADAEGRDICQRRWYNLQT
jgi:hypothetical protein